MRRRAALYTVALTALLSMVAAAAATAASAEATDEVSVIVVLDGGADAAAVAPGLAAQLGGRAPQVFSHVLGGFQFVGPAAAVAALAHAPGVRAVVPDEAFALVDVAGTGFFRIDAEQSINDPQGPYRGAGARVAVIDSGIDTDHPDLAPNLDLSDSYNCIRPGTVPEDDNGHGTHVAGIAAAAFNANGFGLVGVAPSARIVSFKAFDAGGNGTTAQIICALDRLAALTADKPMPTALNMSFADAGTDSQCDDGISTDALHEALCDVVSTGATYGVPVVPVAAGGNESVDAASTIPAAFHDVIAVSALADHDGAGGGLAGCPFVSGEFNFECDDTLAAFSNWGASIDLAAPGVEIYSDYLGGGLEYLSGTSMAAPHVTGVVALVLGANPSLSPTAARTLLLQTGECPDGSEAGSDASCAGQGQWLQTANQSIFDPVETKPDPDGIAEPLVNAFRAARAAASTAPPPTDATPTVAITSPVGDASVAGTVTVSGTAGDDRGVTQVEVFVDGGSIGTTTPSGGAWSLPWDTTAVVDGAHTLTAVATDTVGQTGTSGAVGVTVANTAPVTVMHVGALSASASGGRRWTATATVTIVDTVGNPVSGATVTFAVATGTFAVAAKGGAAPGSGPPSCVTGADGRCSVSVRTSDPAVRFAVSAATRTGWTYDASANVVTAVVVTKP